MKTKEFNFNLKSSDLGEPIYTSRGILTPIVSEEIKSRLLQEYAETIMDACYRLPYEEGKPEMHFMESGFEVDYYLFPRKWDTFTYHLHIVVSNKYGRTSDTVGNIGYTDEEKHMILDHMMKSEILKNPRAKTEYNWYCKVIDEKVS